MDKNFLVMTCRPDGGIGGPFDRVCTVLSRRCLEIDLADSGVYVRIEVERAYIIVSVLHDDFSHKNNWLDLTFYRRTRRLYIEPYGGKAFYADLT